MDFDNIPGALIKMFLQYVGLRNMLGVGFEALSVGLSEANTPLEWIFPRFLSERSEAQKAAGSRIRTHVSISYEGSPF